MLPEPLAPPSDVSALMGRGDTQGVDSTQIPSPYRAWKPLLGHYRPLLKGSLPEHSSQVPWLTFSPALSFRTPFPLYRGLLWWLSGKEPTMPMHETQEDPLEKETVTHSSILAWEIPWTEEPGGATVHGFAKESDMA